MCENYHTSIHCCVISQRLILVLTYLKELRSRVKLEIAETLAVPVQRNHSYGLEPKSRRRACYVFELCQNVEGH